jgi:hypothetical protein
MNRRPIFVALLILIWPLSLHAGSTHPYSDPIGVYALIDKVIFEPSQDAPQRIQIWGAFALASKDDRNSYNEPARGYLYFTCKAGTETPCLKEWADLKAVADTGQVIGFGGRNNPRPRLRKSTDKPSDPDEYPLNYGLIRMRDRNSDYPPVRALKSLPREHN